MSTVPLADLRFPELVRYRYLEELLAHRRVLVVGALSGDSCHRIAELRARVVVGVDPDEELIGDLARQTARANLRFQAMPPTSLSFRDGSFDVVIFPDLSAIADAGGALSEARRVLAPDGFALVALANPEASAGLSGAAPPEMTYTELFEVCSSVFPMVRIVGQSPFVGYALADFTPEEEPGISFDGSLGPDEGEEVEFYLAICSDVPVEVDPYAIVQVPLFAVAPREVEGRTAVSEASLANLSDLHSELAREKELSVERSIKAQRLEHELKAMEEEARKARDRAARFARELEDEKKARQRAEIESEMIRRSPEIAELRDKVSELEVEREQAAAEVRELHARFATVTQERDEALRKKFNGVEELRQGLSELSRELQARDARLKELQAEIDERPAPGRLEALSSETAVLEAQVGRLETILLTADEERGADLTRLENELHSRSRRLMELEQEVARREAIVRDLCVQLEELTRSAGSRAGGSAEDEQTLRASLGECVVRAEDAEGKLAVEVGRSMDRDARIAALEQERQACQWTVAELEARLRGMPAPGSVVDADIAAAVARGYRMRIAELEQELALCGQPQPEGSDERQSLLLHAAELEATSIDLSRELQTARGHATDLDVRVSLLDAERGEAQARAQAAEAREHEGAQEVRKLIDEIDSQRLRLRDALERGDVLLVELQSRQQELVICRREREGAESLGTEARTRLEAMALELLHLRGSCETASTERDNFRYALEARDRELAELRAKLSGLEGDLRIARGAAEDRIAQLRSELSEARAQLTTHAASGETSEANALGVELVRIQDELARCRTEAKNNEVMLRSVMAQLQERDGRLAVFESARRELERLAGDQRAAALIDELQNVLRQLPQQ